MALFMRHDLVWTAARLPYIVTRQPRAIKNRQPAELAVAQCLGADKSPLSRVASCIPLSTIRQHQRPPLLSALNLDAELTSAEQQRFMSALAALATLGIEVRVFGSFLWQYLSGLALVQPESDIDLLIEINDRKQLILLSGILVQLEQALGRRVDGELCFASGYTVAWREYFNASHSVLVKTLHEILLLPKTDLWQR